MKIYTLPIEMVNALRSWFHPKDRHLYLANSQYIISRRVAWETMAAKFQGLPGLRGFWSMGSLDGTGGTGDLSGQARALTYNGNPVYNLYDSIVPYIDFDGVDDYLDRADEAGTSITGSETFIASSVRGLTVGGWFWLDALSGGTPRGLIGKNVVVGNQRSYTIFLTSTDILQFAISSNGTATTTVNSTVGAQIGQWMFLVGRFIPSREIAIFVNGTKTTNTTSIPSSIFDSTAAFEIGRFLASNTNAANCRASQCFLCASALPDELVTSLYEQTKILFGL